MRHSFVRSFATLALCCVVFSASLSAQSWIRGSFGPGGPTGQVNAIDGTSFTDLVIGGSFASMGGVPANNVARWNGIAWAPLGAGVPVSVSRVVRRPNGNVLTLDGLKQVREWNGIAWTALGPAFGPGIVRDLRVLANGTVVVGIATTSTTLPAIMAFNPVTATWAAFGAAGTQASIVGDVHGIQEASGGVMVAAGRFYTGPTGAGPFHLASWNGSVWTPVTQPAGAPGIFEVFRIFRNGDFVVHAHLPNAVYEVRRFSQAQAAWKTEGVFDLQVRGLCELQTGDILVLGDFGVANSVPAARVARLSRVMPVAVTTLDQAALTAVAFADGNVAIGGTFTTVNGNPSTNLELFAPTVTPRVSSIGGGCLGSTLRPLAQPFLGTTFATTASNMPVGFALQIRGLTRLANPVPVGPIFGGPNNGCNVAISSEIVDLVNPIGGGTVRFTFTIPNDATLLGANLFHQVVALDAAANAVATDALALKFGAF